MKNYFNKIFCTFVLFKVIKVFLLSEDFTENRNMIMKIIKRIIFVIFLCASCHVTVNANPDVPHLHLTTSVGGTSTNPADYLNATVSTTATEITTPCD